MSAARCELEDGPMRDALELLARRPQLPPTYMALMLDQPHHELLARLTAAAAVGWLTTQRACCGHHDRFTITPAGRALL